MTNFQRLIRDLIQRCGFSEAAIGECVGVTQPAISRLKLTPGAEPRWSTGDALIRLHKKEMRKL